MKLLVSSLMIIFISFGASFNTFMFSRFLKKEIGKLELIMITLSIFLSDLLIVLSVMNNI